jgi:DNA (cytosine-5)-methyltransferase 1
MRYLSICSGISAETQAWSPLGWTPVAFAQHDPEHKYKGGPDFASAVLAHRYPGVPNLGDATRFQEWPDYADVDVLAGGTPCQSYSVAGLRAGLDDPRGDLSLVYAAIARRYRPAWVVWENVGGVLSNDGGRAFASILGLLSGRRVQVPAGGWRTAGVVPGIDRAYGLAWRVLDTQYVRVDGFGRAVPQRRRRVFVVGYLGDWRRAAAVLFECEGLQGDSPPRRAPGQNPSGTITGSLGARRGVGEADHGVLIPEVANVLTARCKHVNSDLNEGQTLIPAPVAATLTAGRNNTGGDRFPGMTADEAAGLLIPVAFKPSHFTRGKDGAPQDVTFPLSADADRGDQEAVICAPIAFDCKAGADTGFSIGEVPGSLRAHHGGGHAAVCIPFDTTQITNPNNRINPEDGGPAYPLSATAHPPAIAFQDRFRGDDGRGYDRPPLTASDLCGTLDTVKPWNVATAWSVRRLMPVECERLQGFPDDFTAIPYRGKPAADGPRYKVLGNAQSVNVMRWIGRRIEMVRGIEG